MKVKAAEIAALTGVNVRTLYRWKRSRPKLYAVLVRGVQEIKFDEVRK